MKNYVIVAESGADLLPDIIEKYGIEIVPMYVEMGGKLYKDGTFPLKDLFQYYKDTHELPKTSGCGPKDFEEVFDRIHQEHPEKHIIHLAYSAVTTVSYQSAVIASEDRDYVTSIDTKHVSAGQALVVRKTAEHIEKHPDISVSEIVSYVERLRERSYMCFLPETLMYLKAGGRVSNPAYLGARLLNIKPLIEINEGKLTSTSKYRGSMMAAASKLIPAYCKSKGLSKEEITFICGFGLDEAIKKKAEALAEQLGFKQIRWNPTGCVVSAHGGPQAFGITGYSD